jgi:hypothetical protein
MALPFRQQSLLGIDEMDSSCDLVGIDVQSRMDAGGNEDIYPVPIKTMNQQQMTALHRMRSSWT